MTRKDYKLIASVFARAHYSVPNEARLIAEDLANALTLDNPRFDREKFLAACGGEK